jgi:hypothetical protein
VYGYTVGRSFRKALHNPLSVILSPIAPQLLSREFYSTILRNDLCRAFLAVFHHSDRHLYLHRVVFSRLHLRYQLGRLRDRDAMVCRRDLIVVSEKLQKCEQAGANARKLHKQQMFSDDEYAPDDFGYDPDEDPYGG